ncbi:MAG: hypothetical protein V3S44_10730 [Alphaproteobacteria bacterium]
MILDREAEAALRARARKLQALHINLLFCRPTRQGWADDPDAVLAAFGLEPADRELIADITTEQFQAEAHGRRAVVERGIGRCFESTLARLAERAAGPGFDEFLCSEYFLDPRHGLPHRSGVGPGYENISKWFFWLRHTCALDRPGADIALRTDAYAEFAVWLIDEYKRPHDPFYDQFQGGLFWPRSPGEALPVMLLTEDYMQVTVTDARTADQLPEIGLIDLDTLRPPEHQPEPTLS